MILFILLLILALDQFTKFFASSNLPLSHPHAVIPGFFYLTLVHNRGAAFGILKDQLLLFILTSLVTIILIYWTLVDSARVKPPLVTVAFSLILAGAVGNLIDRLLYGYVIDFLDFSVWPVFNIADSAITIGAILLGWYLITTKKRKAHNA